MQIFNSFNQLPVFCCTLLLIWWAWKIQNWAWFRPKKMEKWLRQQGLDGNCYQLLFGDTKEMLSSLEEAKSKPVSLTDDVVSRIMPFICKASKNYGKISFTWLGPAPAVLLFDSELAKEVFTKNYIYQKPPTNSLTKLLTLGLGTLNTEKWAKHRGLMNPAFHLEKLKQMLPAFYLCCMDMLSKWEEMALAEGSFELDVWPYLQKLTGHVISRTAFGSSFEEEKKYLNSKKNKLSISSKLSSQFTFLG